MGVLRPPHRHLVLLRRGAVLNAADVLAGLTARLAPSGIDLVHPFRVSWYNRAVTADLRLPDLGRDDALGVLIGNTRAMWAPFLDAVREDPTLRDAADPLDRWVERQVQAAVAPIPLGHELRFAPEPPPRRVAMQRLAHLTGLAWLSPSYLNVHPTYGPWLALRAVAVLDLPGPDGEAPEAAPPAGCACEARCRPPLQAALDTVRDRTLDQQAITDAWRRWVAVRDACPTGAAFRYPEDQIRYHYTRDRAVFG